MHHDSGPHGLEEVIHAITRGIRDHEDRVGIRAEEKPACLSEEQPVKAEQVSCNTATSEYTAPFDDRKEQEPGDMTFSSTIVTSRSTSIDMPDQDCRGALLCLLSSAQ